MLAGGLPAVSEGLRLLLQWTEELDDEQAITLWAGLTAVEDPFAREAALRRWTEWAGVTIPPLVTARDLVLAVATLTTELETVARNADRVYLYDPEDLIPFTRSLHGWMRAHESQFDAFLGAARAIFLARKVLLTRAKKPAEEPPATPVEPLGESHALLISTLRNRIERASTEEAVELLLVYLRAEPATALAPWAIGPLEFALFMGDLQGRHFRAVALLASQCSAVWCELVRSAATPRDALRAVRLLGALASHESVARELPPTVSSAAVEALVAALAHPRVGVWSRAARALGRVAGVLQGASQRLITLLDPATAALVRRRAHAALGNLSVFAGEELLSRRASLLDSIENVATAEFVAARPPVTPVELNLAPVSEAAAVAAMAVSLPDLASEGGSTWVDLARLFSRRGGPEAWNALARSLHEIRQRLPQTRALVEHLAHDVRARAEAWRGVGADAERAERAVALAARLVTDEGHSIASLVGELARMIDKDPVARGIRMQVEGFGAAVDVLVSNSSKAAGHDEPRVAARGSMVLEEVVELVVDGDLWVIAHRAGDGGPRAAALAVVDALRARLLKMVWTGLRRPTPASFAWRRWMLRTAATLPRVAPPGRRPQELVLQQVYETVERVAEDPLFAQGPLLRYVAVAVSDLAEELRPTLGPHAIVSVVGWFALRGVLQPTHGRIRRWLGDASLDDAFERLFHFIESSERTSREIGREIAGLGALMGGERCRVGVVLTALGAECTEIAQRRPETHWSGLPRFDLTDLAGLADSLAHARQSARRALSIDEDESPSASPGARPQDTLFERASRVNRMLTATSLKFMDAARRGEVIEHYMSELAALTEAIATTCGPLLAHGVRALLARALVAVRAMANEALREREGGARYIGRLKVLGELSSSHEGGMTSTYLAEGTAPGKKLVVKLLPWARFKGTSADLARAMFEGEMERLGGVVHPNIVSIIDAGFVDEGAYIALEHIPGASLETLLRKFGRVNLSLIAPVVRDVARALAYLHGRRVVHRDVKPGNVVVQPDLPDGAPLDVKTWAQAEIVRGVLIDFGIATEVSQVGAHEGVTGTPGYIAPEIARGLGLVGPAMDVYSLAVVVFEMLTGSNPFLEGQSELAAVLVRHGSMSLPWQRLPSEAGRPELIQLLADATRLDPRQRPSMRDFLTRWTRATAGL